MDNIALYRKYRPHNFDNLVGQDYIKTTLINVLKRGNVSHAYLFSGPRGTGKTSTARLLAKAMNCTNLKDNYEPCDECEFCSDINDGRLIDLIEIDAASNRGIDEVRDLKEKINFAPSRSKYKIYIVDEVHMMTKDAFNALLKTLEEPPSHAFFILATTEVHKIPETIISRCQRFDFKRISDKALMTRLSYIAQKEEIKVDDMALELIARYVDGGMRDAIGLMEQLTTENELNYSRVKDVLGVSDISLLTELQETILSKNTKESLRIIQDIHDQGSDLKKFAHEFVDDLRGKMIEAVYANDNDNVKIYIRLIALFQEAQERLNYATLPQLPLEIAVIKATVNIDIAEDVSETLPVKDTKKTIPVVTKTTPKESPPSNPEPLNTEPKKASKEAPIEKEELPRDHKGLDSIDLETIEKSWPRIIERIKTPSLTNSLKTCVLVEIKGHNLVLEFSSNFHRETVMNHDNRVEVETIINDVLSFPVKVSSIAKEIEIKPIVSEDDFHYDIAENEEPSPPAETSETAQFNEALDIFEGKAL